MSQATVTAQTKSKYWGVLRNFYTWISAKGNAIQAAKASRHLVDLRSRRFTVVAGAEARIEQAQSKSRLALQRAGTYLSRTEVVNLADEIYLEALDLVAEQQNEPDLEVHDIMLIQKAILSALAIKGTTFRTGEVKHARATKMQQLVSEGQQHYGTFLESNKNTTRKGRAFPMTFAPCFNPIISCWLQSFRPRLIALLSANDANFADPTWLFMQENGSMMRAKFYSDTISGRIAESFPERRVTPRMLRFLISAHLFDDIRSRNFPDAEWTNLCLKFDRSKETWENHYAFQEDSQYRGIPIDITEILRGIPDQFVVGDITLGTRDMHDTVILPNVVVPDRPITRDLQVSRDVVDVNLRRSKRRRI